MNQWCLDDLDLIQPDHIYIHRPTRREVPGTTGRMRKHGLGFQGVAPEEALRRGTFAHEASVLVDENDLDWDRVPEKWRGYVRAYEAAVRDSRTKPLVAEWRFFHPSYWYAGTLDRIALRDGRRGLVELKTGDTTDVDVQCGAYSRGWTYWNPAKPIEWAECWKLNEDGTYRVTPVDLNGGWNVFAAILVIEARVRKEKAAA